MTAINIILQISSIFLFILYYHSNSLHANVGYFFCLKSKICCKTVLYNIFIVYLPQT